jgi:hypothetical protein
LLSIGTQNAWFWVVDVAEQAVALVEPMPGVPVM